MHDPVDITFSDHFKSSSTIAFYLSSWSQDKRHTSIPDQLCLIANSSPSDVPIIRCIGLNYIKHIKEGGRTPPPYPSVFIKPSTSIAGFEEDVPIPKVAQDGTIDYKGELTIVIGKAGKDIPKESALQYVAGYCAANDVSCRGWQRDLKKAGGVPQWCFSKGFDKFAPLGPMIVSPAIVGNASDLTLGTLVNGEERQSTRTVDLLFGVEERSTRLICRTFSTVLAPQAVRCKTDIWPSSTP